MRKSAEQMIVETLAVLQRGLPSGDLNDRQVITELWGIFDHPNTRETLDRAKTKSLPIEPKAL
jgi:hypothetical protein